MTPAQAAAIAARRPAIQVLVAGQVRRVICPRTGQDVLDAEAAAEAEGGTCVYRFKGANRQPVTDAQRAAMERTLAGRDKGEWRR
jgi:hypothetical protein